MFTCFGNTKLEKRSVPTCGLTSPVLEITKSTTIGEISEFYNTYYIDGEQNIKMTAEERREYTASHFPKMRYKGFEFFMQLATNGRIEDFLTVREIEVDKNKIKLYKVVPDSAVTAIEMSGFDPNAPKTNGMTQLHAWDSGKQYFAGKKSSTDIFFEYIKNPVLLTVSLDMWEFDQAEFVFNSIDQLYTSHVVNL